jgi:hypothetical protein
MVSIGTTVVGDVPPASLTGTSTAVGDGDSTRSESDEFGGRVGMMNVFRAWIVRAGRRELRTSMRCGLPFLSASTGSNESRYVLASWRDSCLKKSALDTEPEA